MDNWDLMNVSNDEQDLEINLEEESSEKDEEVILDADEENLEEENEKESSDDQKKNKTTRRKKRAQKRIQQLNARAKAAEEREQELTRKLKELEHNTAKEKVSTAKSQKESLLRQEKELKEDLERALDTNDVGRALTIQSNLSRVTNNLENLVIPDEPVIQETSNNQQTQVTYEDPGFDLEIAKELSEEWIDQNFWYEDDDHLKLRKLADRITNKLLNEGFVPDDEEFFEELDLRFNKRVDELGYDVPGKTKSQKQKTSPVSAGTKSSNTVSSKKASSKSVRLTQDEVAMARKLGLSPKQYAEAKLEQEQVRVEDEDHNVGGYTVLRV